MAEPSNHPLGPQPDLLRISQSHYDLGDEMRKFLNTPQFDNNDRVSNALEQLTMTTQQTSTTVQQLSTTVQQLGMTVQQLSTTVQQLGTTMQEVQVQLRQVNTKLDALQQRQETR